MALTSKFVRHQLEIFMPKITQLSLEIQREGQDKIGALMANTFRKKVTRERLMFTNFESAWIYPRDEIRDGVILYVHGGGYVCGNIDYVCGFGSMLASKHNMKVFCIAYRLAPENKFPAAQDDAFEAYEYLLNIGIKPSSIILCGESAGGGLIYSLCLKLKALGMEMPGGVIAISPWSDLTLSGESYEFNKEKDPSLTRDRLQFFSESYTDDPQNPFVSPLLADLGGMPPSLIFAGGDEILLSDSTCLHEKLLENNCSSKLIVTPNMWHAYLLYDFNEYKSDYDEIEKFIETIIPSIRKLRWMKLDNAAKIYPAAKRKNWNNMFRLSATLNEKIDRKILQSALDVTARRFPSIAARLRVGTFWYYLEELPKAPKIEDEKSCPLLYMPFGLIRKCAFRVIIYENRISVEFYHAITDGNGGLVFLKSLVAEYIKQKYNVTIPCENGVLDRLEEPRPEELEDSFLKHSGTYKKSRSEANSFHIDGELEENGYRNLVTMMINVNDVMAKAKEYGVTLTTFICSVLIKAICELQDIKTPQRKKQKQVKVLVPVDLRRLFGSSTLRNFVLYVTPGVDPRVGEWSFDEICKSVGHQFGLEITRKGMMSRITPNVESEKSPLIRVLPLFIKNIAMKSVYNAIAEKKSCLSLSNLGAVKIPEEMKKYVNRFDFILGTLVSTHNNCGVLSYNETLYVNFIRNIKNATLELKFYEVMRSLGINVKVESNQR